MTARAGTASRDSLGCHFEIRHFGVWRAAVAFVSMAAIAALGAWAASGSPPRPPEVLAATVAAAGVVVWLGLSLARGVPGTLNRRSGSWSFMPEANGTLASEPEVGDLAVAIDLGSFMLLVLTRPGRGRRWLPVQRHGNEAGWHALRAAAHAPRPLGESAQAGLE